jgi:hypothetical protein
MAPPKVFIGSSVEGLKIAEAIKTQLDYQCDVTIWSEGVFGLSKGTLETLCDAIKDFDFGIFVTTGEDLLESRGIAKQTPRDNVLLELGMFIGHLGRERTFLVYDKEADIKLPSDLAGVTQADYRMHSDRNITASVGSACIKIKQAIATEGRRVPQDQTERRRKMEYHVSLHDSSDSIENFSSIGLLPPLPRVKGGMDQQLDFSRYHILSCSLNYTLAKYSGDKDFSVAIATESAKLNTWFRDKSVIYRELMTLDIHDAAWWRLLISDLRSAKQSGSTLDSLLAITHEVARFHVRINGETVVPKNLTVPRTGGFLLNYEWPSLSTSDSVDFSFEYIGLQARSQSWFPIVIAEPSEAVELTFDYALDDRIGKIDHFEIFDSDIDPIVSSSEPERVLTINHTNKSWVRHGGVLIYWRPS